MMRSLDHDSPRAGQKIPQRLPSATHSNHRSTVPHKSGPNVHPGDASALFVEDRKGDRNNLTYGSLDRYAVPRYRASGGGTILGLSSKYRITSRTETRCEVENVALDSTRRARRQSLLSNVVNEDPAPLKLTPVTNNQDDLQKGFLRFENEHSRKRRRIAMPNDQQNSDTEDASSTSSDPGSREEGKDAFEAFRKDPVHQRHVELSRATVENPQDSKVWLAFIDYQDTSFSREHGIQGLGISSGRSLIDLKLSLYEQALSHVKDPEGRQSLILRMMQEGSKIWDAEKHASQWRTFLNKDSSVELWILYLNFVQSNQVRFTFETCLGIYMACLQNFQALEHGRKRDSACIYLLLRCSLFLWQSGFTERAVGIWQALFEYNFFPPQHSKPEELLESFQQFWASEVARIGEEGAAGWSSTISVELEPVVDKQGPHMSKLDFATWAAAEDDLDRCAGMPARSLDDISESDPYRVLLFADIKDFLFSPSTKEGLKMLQDAFLLFSGLPVLSCLAEASRWKGDPFIYVHSRSAEKWSMSMDLQDDEHDLYTIVSSGRSLSQHDNFPDARTLADLHLAFVRRFLLLAAMGTRKVGDDDLLAEYVIALEARADLKSAKKLAKSILKQKPDSLNLYNAYAILEDRLDNLEAAQRVWSTAISMRASLGSVPDSITLPLWRAWVYSYMTRKRFHEAELLLGMLADGQIDMAKLQAAGRSGCAQSVATQIKTEKYLKDQFESNLTSSDTRVLPDLVDVLANYKYLTHGLNLEAALEVYENCLSLLAGRWNSDARLVETVHEYRAHLLHSHATTFGRPYRPREYCLILAESVRAFPINLRLLMLQHDYAQRSGLFDRLRQLDSHAQADEQFDHGSGSVIPGIFSILTELRRPSYAGSTNHSIRSAFKRAVDPTGPGYHCIAIWKAYVMWEVSVVSREQRTSTESRQDAEAKRRQGPQRVTEAFYASLRACPWSKELYMLGFTEEILRNSLGFEGLKQVYGSMQDRGLRLHIDSPG